MPQPCSVLRRFFLAANLPQDAKLIPTKTHLPISRREFFISTVVGLTVLKFDTARAQESSSTPFLERRQSGTPHQGKVLAAIQPHSDDVALLCSGTVAKLIQEGSTDSQIKIRSVLPPSDVMVRHHLHEHLLRDHPNCPEPLLDQPGPLRHRKLRTPQTERMFTLRIQMHLHRDPGLL